MQQRNHRLPHAGGPGDPRAGGVRDDVQKVKPTEVGEERTSQSGVYGAWN